MAHAAPAPGGMPRRGGTPEVTAGHGPGGHAPVDVFEPRTHAIGRIAWPVGLGLIYGFWVADIVRSGRAITGSNLLLGFISALVFALVYMAVLAIAPHVRREVHALLWTAFVGTAFGFMYTQATGTYLRGIGYGLLLSIVTYTAFFYRYYTREDEAGHRVR